MTDFLKKLLLFGSISMVSLFALDHMVTMGLKKSNAFVFENLTRIHSHNLQSDLIINGSSKALVQFSTQIIDSSLGTNSYNFGMNGANFELQHTVYQLYRTNNSKPKAIVQVVGDELLKYNQNLHEYKRFAPYLDDSLVVDLAKRLNGFKAYDYYIPFVRYSGFTDIIINGLANYFGINLPSNKSNKYKGYIAYDKPWDYSFNKFVTTNPNGIDVAVDPRLISLFEEYVSSSLKDRIKVILVYPPSYFESQKFINNRNQIIEMYRSIANEYNIVFIDYSEHELCKNKDYFYNSQHLNKKGAEYFSKLVAVDLDKALNKN